VIEEVSDEKVSVSFTKSSACGDCHAQAICASFVTPERKIVIETTGEKFRLGEEVEVLLKRSMGLKATLIAYLFPFILMLTALIASTSLPINELTTGLSVIVLISLYFICLYIFRDRLKKQFHFILRKNL